MRARLAMAGLGLCALVAPAAADGPKLRPCPAGSVRMGAAPPDGLSVWCERGGVHHGPYVMWFPSGQVMRKGFVHDGALQGKQVVYYEDGQKADVSYYQAGVPVGIWRHWHRNGKLASKTRYKRGVKHGWSYRWHDNGVVALREKHRRGKLLVSRRYEPDGTRWVPPPETWLLPRVGALIDRWSCARLFTALLIAEPNGALRNPAVPQANGYGAKICARRSYDLGGLACTLLRHVTASRLTCPGAGRSRARTSHPGRSTASWPVAR